MTERESTGHPPELGKEIRVEEIAEQYLDRLQAGETPDREALIAAHPGLTGLLEQELSLVEALHRAGRHKCVEKTPNPPGGDDSPPEEGGPGIDPGPSDDPPLEVGPFKILKVLGIGGMGAVYLAEQVQPVRRQVALKLIKLGMNTREVVGRFDNERQALALMSHPHIAQVFEAGAADDGRPYFVMEHVPGDPITDFCDSRRMTVRERLALFSKVCDAVQHAHQKGVIHRDLKPSNILVLVVDGRPAPKIIDFGVAKATDQRLAERAISTEDGRIVGTPEYMSPEQAGMDSLDIDTRSDIYSLGAILYELLTGAQPFDSEELRKLPYDEIRRRIREEDPRKPSTRLSELARGGGEVARRRQAGGGALKRLLKGDLDWIVMKALEKDRTRRYATASELSADIARHLRSEPVLAGPPTRTYRLGKFVRKHKGAVMGGMAVAVALLAGMAMSAALYVRADRERDDAVRARQAEAKEHAEAERQRGAAEAARGEAERQREVAEAARSDALDQREAAVKEANRATAISNFLLRVLKSADPARGGREVKVADALDGAARSIDADLAGHPEAMALLHGTIGLAYQNLGIYDKAEPHLRSCLEIRRRVLGADHPRTMEAASHLALLLGDRGDLEEAGGLFREVLADRIRVLGEDDPETLAARSNLGAALQAQGRLAEAEPILRQVLEDRRRTFGDDDPETLKFLNNLATLLQDRGELSAAESLLRQAMEAHRRVLGAEHSDTLASTGNLAALLTDLGKLAEAESLSRGVLEDCRRVLGESHPRTMIAMNNLVTLFMAQGKLDEAEPLSRRSLARFREILGEEHPHTQAAMLNYGGLLLRLGRLSRAEPFLRQALKASRRILGEDHPRTFVAMYTLSLLLRRKGKMDEAESLSRRALAGSRAALSDDHPDTLQAAEGYGALLLDLGRHDEAEPPLLRAYQGLHTAFGPDHERTRKAIEKLIDLYSSRGDEDKTEEYRALLRAPEEAPEKE